MEIPWESLEEEVLLSLIEEIVTRDGTDYGVSEKTSEQKVAEVVGALKSKRAVIFWDMDLESASISMKNP